MSINRDRNDGVGGAGRVARDQPRKLPSRLARLMAMLLLAPAALPGCSEPAQARFTATCAPNEALEDINCTLQNTGDKLGRACLTARVQPERGPPLISRRACSGPLEPGQKVGLVPSFPQLEWMKRKNTLAKRCASDGSWTCKVDIVEEQGMLGDNLPVSR